MYAEEGAYRREVVQKKNPMAQLEHSMSEVFQRNESNTYHLLQNFHQLY
jgi:hypothetical protein